MIEKKKLIQLYNIDRKSMKEISLIIGCSLNKVQYWINKYGIPARSRSEALYIKHNPEGDPFKLKHNYSNHDLILLGLGLGLWWGEGSKKHHGTIRLGNTDPRLIQKFVQFLTEICGVKFEKIRFGLQIFSDVNAEDAKNFWMNALNAMETQFLPKIVVTKTGKIGTYREKNKFGVLTVYCANIKLRSAFDRLMHKYAFPI